MPSKLFTRIANYQLKPVLHWAIYCLKFCFGENERKGDCLPVLNNELNGRSFQLTIRRHSCFILSGWYFSLPGHRNNIGFLRISYYVSPKQWKRWWRSNFLFSCFYLKESLYDFYHFKWFVYTNFLYSSIENKWNRLFPQGSSSSSPIISIVLLVCCIELII